MTDVTVSAICTFEVLAAHWTSDVLVAADFVDQQSCIVYEVEIAGKTIVMTSNFVVSHCASGGEPSQATFEGAFPWIGLVGGVHCDGDR